MLDQFANGANSQGYGKSLRLDVLPAKIDTVLQIIHDAPPLSAPLLQSTLAFASPFLALFTVLWAFEPANERCYLPMPLGQLPQRCEKLLAIFAGYHWK